MVESTAYKVRSGQWVLLTRATHQSRGVHAERQLFIQHEANAHLLFSQDAAPCEECHAFFLQQSLGGNRSFIFIVTAAGSGKLNKGSGYPILAGTTVTPTVTTGGGDGEEATETTTAPYALKYHMQVDTSQLPLTLFYHNGQAFLNLRPNDFPPVPSIASF